MATFKAVLQKHHRKADRLTRENLNPGTGTVMTGIISGVEGPVTIHSLVKQNEDGTVDKQGSDRQLVYTDAEGKRNVVSVDRLESIRENLPPGEVTEGLVQGMAAPVVQQQMDDEVRDYETGEPVRTVTGFYGKIAGRNEDGTYRIDIPTPAGMQPVSVRPSEIVNEDHLREVNDGDEVEYTKQGVTARGEISGLNDPEMRRKGSVFVDEKEVPVENIVGKVKNEAGAGTLGTEGTEGARKLPDRNCNRCRTISETG
jgi:hypothetical protein